MKALTIWQPWATLIMIGAKPWEWRGWQLPKSMVGQRIVVHAGAHKISGQEYSDLCDMLRSGDTSLVIDIASPFLKKNNPFTWSTSVGLGTVVLGAPIRAADWAAEHDKPGLDSDRIDHSKWAWPVSDIQPFAQPISCRGAQGFWNWPAAGVEM